MPFNPGYLSVGAGRWLIPGLIAPSPVRVINNVPQNQFEQNNVKLSTGEYVSKDEYNKLSPENQKSISDLGIEKYNEAQKVEQDKVLASNIELQKQFEQDNVKLSTGEYVSKVEYDALAPDKQAILQTGIANYNAAQKVEQNKFLAANVALPDGKYISNSDAEKIKAETPDRYNILTTQGYDAYVKSAPVPMTNGVPNGYIEPQFHDYVINKLGWNEGFYAQYGQQAFLTYFQNSTGGNIVWTPKTVNPPATNYNPVTGEILPGSIPGFDVNGHAIPGFPVSAQVAGITSYDSVINGVPYLKGVPVVSVPKEYLNPTYSTLKANEKPVSEILQGGIPVSGIVVGTSPTEGKVLVKDANGLLSWQPGDPSQITEAGLALSLDNRYDKTYIPPTGITLQPTKATPLEINATQKEADAFWKPYIVDGKFIGTPDQYDAYLRTRTYLQSAIANLTGTATATKAVALNTLDAVATLKGVNLSDYQNVNPDQIENLLQSGITAQMLVNAGVDYSKVTAAVDNLNVQFQVQQGDLDRQQAALGRLVNFKNGDGYDIGGFLQKNPTQDSVQILKDAKFPTATIDAAQKLVDGVSGSVGDINFLLSPKEGSY